MAKWKYARHGNSHRKMPKWLDYHTCPINMAIDCSCVPMVNEFPSDRFIVLQVEYNNYEDCTPHRYAAIRNGLMPQIPLSTNITYTLRYKYIPFKLPSSCESTNFTCPISANLSVYFTNYAYHWNSDDDDNQKIEEDNLSEVGPFNDCNWKLREKDFILDPDHDNLLNIVFVCNEQGFMIDDVELFEKCPAEKNIQNKDYFRYVYSSNYCVETAANILKAGCCIDPNQSFGDVLVENSSMVKFTAGEQISLLSGFRAEEGSEFKASIVPCEGSRNYSIKNPNSDNDGIAHLPEISSSAIEKNESEYSHTNDIIATIITISPNPANKMLFIEGVNYPFIVSTYDLSGKKMFSDCTNNGQLDISDLSQGLYFIKIETNEGMVVKKFVKE